jgi:uncharacterized membrane protein YphA (DoxX/SURF4 family)
MSLETSLDHLHARVRSRRPLWWFAVMNRILLAIAFMPSGLVKLRGERFTSLGLDNPVGFFFEAMYRTGFYWNFLGMAQLTAALLLLIPRTSTLGAVIYFPIIVNIFLITASMHFQGTWIITGLMLLANLYLLCWDYDRWKGILGWSSPSVPATSRLASSRQVAGG